jgi:predicted DNA repair protein MutK
MASGLAALLDDVAAIAKLAAASLDDVTGAAGKASAKAAGVVVDDAAVTPAYAVGFSPARELPIVWKIALGSLRNKFLILLPCALLLSAFAPWAITPLLMLGGAYLCFEATENLLEALGKHSNAREPAELAPASADLERRKVSGAIRTDLILSAEITAIALANVSDRPLVIQAAALALVGFLLTVGVYGVVAMIVKMDDIGLHLAQRRSRILRRVGVGLVRAMPSALGILAAVGTAAMLWVGGGIIVHGLHEFQWDTVPHLVEAAGRWAGAAPLVGPVAGWLAYACCSAALGLGVGALLVAGLHLGRRATR